VSGPGRDPTPPEDGPGDPRELASAGRSCSVILVLVALLLVLFCVGVAVRLVTTG
jgi:hypothetical protein